TAARSSRTVHIPVRYPGSSSREEGRARLTPPLYHFRPVLSSSAPPHRHLVAIPEPRRHTMTRTALLLATALTVGTALAQNDATTAPGELHTVGDHALHLYCVGEGSPTVIL